MKKLFWFGAGMLALSGCTILTDAVTQDIAVRSNPPGANCSLTRDGVLLGRANPTPGSVLIRMDNSRDITVSCSLSGYQDASRVINRGLGELVWIGGSSGWGTTAPRGADAKYENPVVINLVPAPAEAVASRLPGASLGDLANEGDANIILRFQTLERLFDEGLITREEYNRRRGANLGALLRYTAAPPAIDLSRSAPKPEQVVDRLRYLAVAFEEKSISAREQTAERTIILDALLPATPRFKADPPPPVTDELQAAAVVGRLERLAAANVINAKEQAKEREAVFRSVQAARASAEAAASAAVGVLPPPTQPRGPGVMLGSYSSENQARLAWASLQLTHAAELGSLRSEIKQVRLRRRGVTYYLNVGTLQSRQEAIALCKTLKSRRQFCKPTVFGK
ncbi:SPOR domain-containing protein [Telmatospirillum siberiense]|uniref:SPOR domain-containing protein n=1 Tax=Telmatospirillum siberiense TaxID=382514 RepID=A0A2N3PP98_9PROT|nr:SPOR domain-containing protein [Telmatospirillum siberiense]PKU22222.1 hypothetical protein CWS72_23000 [Telmatospirillum siberiense]